MPALRLVFTIITSQCVYERITAVLLLQNFIQEDKH